MIGVLVILNNWFHDFAVAILFVALVFIYIFQKKDFPLKIAQQVYRKIKPLIIGSWIFIIAGGVVRTIAYSKYEWAEAVGKGQVTALVVKHIILVSIVIAGIYFQLKLKALLKRNNL